MSRTVQWVGLLISIGMLICMIIGLFVSLADKNTPPPPTVVVLNPQQQLPGQADEQEELPGATDVTPAVPTPDPSSEQRIRELEREVAELRAQQRPVVAAGTTGSQDQPPASVHPEATTLTVPSVADRGSSHCVPAAQSYCVAGIDVTSAGGFAGHVPCNVSFDPGTRQVSIVALPVAEGGQPLVVYHSAPHIQGFRLGIHALDSKGNEVVAMRFDGDPLTDTEISCWANIVDGGKYQQCGLALRATPSADGRLSCYALVIGGEPGDRKFAIVKQVGNKVRYTRYFSDAIDQTGRNHLRFKVEGNVLTGFINGERVIQVEDDALRSGTWCLITDPGTVADFDGLTVNGTAY